MHSFSVIQYINVGKEALAKLVLIPRLRALQADPRVLSGVKAESNR